MSKPLDLGVPLRPVTRIEIKDQRLLPVAAVDVLPAWPGVPGSSLVLRVVDMISGAVWLAPMPALAVRHLIEQMTAALPAE